MIKRRWDYGMSEERFTETERNCYYTSLVFDNQTQEELGTTKVVVLLNEKQATIEQQEQSITILKQEIADTQAILEMLSEKLKGWNNE